jgi:two-component system chemotaxis response regulator CheB
MVIDDSITARSALARTIEARRDMTVVATAGSAEVGLELLDDKCVDVILLDLEMPGMGGLKALPAIIAKAMGAKILVVSTLTTAGAEPTLAALAMGAADTLAKPSSGNFGEEYRGELVGKIIALARPGGATARRESSHRSDGHARPARSLRTKPGIIAIGASTGGIHALGRFFGALPKSVTAPILVTQHLPQTFMPVFARQVEAMSGRPAKIAEEGMPLKPGQVLIAPGTGHLLLRQSKGEIVVAIEDFTAPSGCRPSVDPMLESVAKLFGAAGLGVVLSGMGRDGSIGAKFLSDAGGTLLAQDEESCAVFGMPRGIVEAGFAAEIDTPEALAAYIAKRAGAV